MTCRQSRLRLVVGLALATIVTVALHHAVGAQNVLDIKTTVTPEKYSGSCPVDLVYTTIITTDVPGEITYRWTQDKSQSEIVTSQSSTDTHTLEMTWTIEKTGAKGQSFYGGARVLTPVQASAKLAQAYVVCTATANTSNEEEATVNTPNQSAEAGGEDAPIVFGTVETEIVGDDTGATSTGGESGDGAGNGRSVVGSTVITEQIEPLGPEGNMRNTVTLRCPEFVSFGIIDDVPDPWWSTGSRVSDASAHVLADARLLVCNYIQGDRQVRISKKFPEGLASCGVPADAEFLCTE
jgi:hypothetical protein